MKLHGFAATVALTHSRKKYLITIPMPAMRAIMCRTLGSGSIWNRNKQRTQKI